MLSRGLCSLSGLLSGLHAFLSSLLHISIAAGVSWICCKQLAFGKTAPLNLPPFFKAGDLAV